MVRVHTDAIGARWRGRRSRQKVLIRKVGDDVILSPRPRDWKAYPASAPVASDTFMADVEDLPVQERGL